MKPLTMVLHCPACDMQHIDEGATKPHRTHQCQGCKHEWQPADVPTVGVKSIPWLDDPISRGLINLVCFLLTVDYVLWVMNGPYWGAM